MTPEENADVIRSLYEAFNAKDETRMTEISAPGALVELLPLGMRATPLEVFQTWARAFPDGKVQIRSITAGGDKVVCEFIGRGTQNGPFHGPMGVLPPTGRRVELEMCEVYELQYGKIVSGRSYFDGASLIRQLGIGAKTAQKVEEREPVPVH